MEAEERAEAAAAAERLPPEGGTRGACFGRGLFVMGGEMMPSGGRARAGKSPPEDVAAHEL